MWRKSASTTASYIGRLAPPGIPKTSLTPSAFSDSINVSAALIGLAMLAVARRQPGPREGPELCLSRRGFGGIPAGAGIDRGLDHAVLVALDDVDHRLHQLL